MATPESLQKLTVEFLGEDGGLHPASVQELGLENRQIYLSFEDNWMENGWYRIDEALYQTPKVDRTDVEQALADGVKDVEVFYALRADTPRTWYPGTIVSETKGFYNIDLDLTKLNSARRVTLPIDDLRIRKTPIQLTLESIHRLQFTLDPTSLAEATSDRSLALIARLGKLDYVRFEPPNNLIIMGYGEAAANRARMLMYFHLQQCSFRQAIKDEIEPKKQHLNRLKSAVCHVELSVPTTTLDNAAVDKVKWKINTENLPAARRLHGIISITPNDEVFDILAANEEAAAQAQELLFHHTDAVYIPSSIVRYIIGVGGETIKTIQQRSNCSLLRICDSPESLATSKLNFQWFEGSSALLLTGTKTETANARMLVECRIDHEQDMARQQREMNVERQKMWDSSNDRRRSSKVPSEPSVQPSEAAPQSAPSVPAPASTQHNGQQEKLFSRTRRDARPMRENGGRYNGYNGHGETQKTVNDHQPQQQQQPQQQRQQQQQPRKQDAGLTNGNVPMQNGTQQMTGKSQKQDQRNNATNGVSNENTQPGMVNGHADNLAKEDGEKVVVSKKQHRQKKKGNSVSSNGSIPTPTNEGPQKSLSVPSADPELAREDQVSR